MIRSSSYIHLKLLHVAVVMDTMATDTVIPVLLEVMKWMDAHDDVLPVIIKHPTPQQKEENSLRHKYKKYKLKTIHLTDAQHALQEEICRRETGRKDLVVQ